MYLLDTRNLFTLEVVKVGDNEYTFQPDVYIGDINTFTPSKNNEKILVIKQSGLTLQQSFEQGYEAIPSMYELIKYVNYYYGKGLSAYSYDNYQIDDITSFLNYNIITILE